MLLNTKETETFFHYNDRPHYDLELDQVMKTANDANSNFYFK